MPRPHQSRTIRALLDRLRVVREIGVPPNAAAGRIHDNRFQQLLREGRISDAHQIGRYAVQRRRAIVVAAIIDLEARLTDAVLDMADKLIGGLFARARKARERRYVARTRNVGRLMRLFHDTIEALGAAQNSERDAFTVVDETVGWARLQAALWRCLGRGILELPPFRRLPVAASRPCRQSRPNWAYQQRRRYSA
jgi:hypothetical protein